jgi:short subunit dehydrogenase-like uncharacterized protein
MEAAKDPAVRRVLSDPYSLVPGGERGPDRREQLGPRLDGERGRWTAPFLMAAPNTRTVRRSNALLGYAYGRGFRYDESFDTGRGLAGLARAASVSAGIAAFAAVAVTAPGRRLLARFLPAPGEGPSREQQERGLFEIEILARSEGGRQLTGRVAGDRDPGYGSTSIMLAEAALSLAQDALPDRGGVLTTASCMGQALIDRLRAAGMTFRVE